MQKVTLVKKGLLEGRPLERVQDEIDDIIIEQKSTITNLKDILAHLKQQALNIETEIEENLSTMLELKSNMSTNRDEIFRLKIEIEKIT